MISYSPILAGALLTRYTALQLIKRGAHTAGFPAEVFRYTFRAAGIATFLLGGPAQSGVRIAAHESTSTTSRSDRRNQEVELKEIERIRMNLKTPIQAQSRIISDQPWPEISARNSAAFG